MSSPDLVTHLAGFAGELRAGGIRVAMTDEIDAAAALGLIDIFDEWEVRFAMRSALKIRRHDWELFDQLFHQYWRAGATPAPREGVPRSLPIPPTRLPRTGVRAASLAMRPAASAQERDEGEVAGGDSPGYSAEALLRQKPFDQCTSQDLAAMERLLTRLTVQIATRPSRRLVPTRHRGLVDLRRSFRRAVGTRGELVSLARRTRAKDEPRVVLLCDTSGSMDPHTRFLLAFVLSFKRLAKRTEVFAFNTTLTRLTEWLSPAKIGPTLDRLAAGVADWSGGTRIGESLTTFVARHRDTLLGPDVVVVILSDGLECGDPHILSQAMRTIHARSRRVIWLNPLLGDSRYQPLARGMEAALPHVDHFASAHNLQSLERSLHALVP